MREDGLQKVRYEFDHRLMMKRKMLVVAPWPSIGTESLVRVERVESVGRRKSRLRSEGEKRVWKVEGEVGLTILRPNSINFSSELTSRRSSASRSPFSEFLNSQLNGKLAGLVTMTHSLFSFLATLSIEQPFDRVFEYRCISAKYSSGSDPKTGGLFLRKKDATLLPRCSLEECWREKVISSEGTADESLSAFSSSLTSASQVVLPDPPIRRRSEHAFDCCVRIAATLSDNR